MKVKKTLRQLKRETFTQEERETHRIRIVAVSVFVVTWFAAILGFAYYTGYDPAPTIILGILWCFVSLGLAALAYQLMDIWYHDGGREKAYLHRYNRGVLKRCRYLPLTDAEMQESGIIQQDGILAQMSMWWQVVANEVLMDKEHFNPDITFKFSDTVYRYLGQQAENVYIKLSGDEDISSPTRLACCSYDTIFCILTMAEEAMRNGSEVSESSISQCLRINKHAEECVSCGLTNKDFHSSHEREK